MSYHYQVYGLNISSELELPELLPSGDQDKTDVSIFFGDTPEGLEKCLKKGVTYEVGQSEFLFEIFDVARFYIADGKSITIRPNEGGRPDDIRLFILGTCFGAILHQRQVLPIHASAIEHQGEAVLFMGSSGAGKSTTASAFRLTGHSAITDDVCPIKIIDGLPYAVPGYPQSKLGEDAMESLAIDKSQYGLVREGIGKRAVRYREGFASEPVRIKACYLLKIEKSAEATEMETIIDSDRFIALKSNVYRKHIAESMKLQFHLLSTIGSIANNCKIKTVKRPQDSSIDEVMAVIKQDLNKAK
ncbi:hypothetical protein GCM10028791_42420 [Echinicola sediminis]